jgi:replicative DNA helicase
MSRQFLPVDEAAERAVLSALLTSPEAFADVSGLLVPEDFGIRALGEIYRACLAVDAATKPVDKVTVAAELKKHRRLAKAGGEEVLDALVDEADTVENALAHAEIVSERALLRRLVDASRSISTEAMAAGADAHDVLAVAESTVFELGVERRRSSMSEMPAAVAEAMELLGRARSSVLVGTSTGFEELDRKTGGLQPGQLVLVAARPSMGKSAFALQLAVNIAEATGLAVPFLSYEMSRSELTMRLLSSELHYDLLKLRSGDLPDGMDLDLAHAAEHLSQLSLLIDDNPPETIAGVRSELRRVARRGPIGGIVIDYVQLMSGDQRSRDENRQQEISAISRGLKRLGTELEVPVVALSQLNRALEARPNKRPMLSDLRDSGCVVGETRLALADGTTTTIAALVDSGAKNVPVLAVDGYTLVEANLSHAFTSGVKETYTVTCQTGHQATASGNHPFLTPHGWVALDDLQAGDFVGVTVANTVGSPRTWTTVAAITPQGEAPVFDATVEGLHNFVANGLVLHNSLEQDANIVLMLYRDSVYHGDADSTLAELIIAKQRSGPVGTVYLDWSSECARFSDTDRKPPANGTGGGWGRGGGNGSPF